MFGVFLGLAAQIAAPTVATHATLPGPISRYISPLDYPPAAIPSKAQGSVSLHLTVNSDGRLAQCDIAKSSGSAILDNRACWLLQRRLKFTPARDLAGHPMTDVIDVVYVWHLPPPELLARMH